MKKFMLMVAMAVATLTANAQVYVGGGLGFNSYDSGVEGADTKTSFAIAPEIGYKLDDQLAVGIELGYGHDKQGDAKYDAFKIAPYARYTFAKWGKVGLFADAQFAYLHEKNGDSKLNTWSLGIKPGLSVDLTENWTFLTKIGWLGYESAKADAEGAKASSDFGLNLNGTNLSFAVVYNF